MLHLPDVAELVRDEVVGDVGAPEEDDAVRREAGVGAPGREPEQPRRDDDANARDANGPRPPVEPVEAGLRPDQPGIRSAQGVVTGSRSMIAPPSWLDV